MAVIHDTTMVPGKLELLQTWLPAQPWYLAPGREPVLAKAGGFRLDDPEGEVGTDLCITTADATGAAGDDLLLRVHRVLRPGDGGAAASGGGPGVTATWRLPDGSQVRGTFVTARYLA